VALQFDRLSPNEEPATVLLKASEETLTEMYGSLRGPTTKAELAPPLGGYLVGWRDGEPVAGGGFRRWVHATDTAEIRRMYVVPELRRQGIARLLLSAIEVAARDAGYVRVILDTGAKQPHALALYRSSGYRDIARYAGSGKTAVYWGEKLLA
jgi:GNAT superfamily N-acetyltransferase